MDYLTTIGCQKEPFCAVAGADIFLSQHLRDTLEKLTHSIRLGAGLHIVTGAEGTGKTTLVQQLSDKFSAEKNIMVLALDTQQFSNEQQFLGTLAGAFKSMTPAAGASKIKKQEEFNTFFLKQCKQENKTVLLLIDNGHLLPDFCIQVLDGLYEHHADCRRLLQTVICGEASLQKNIKAVKNFKGRVVFTANLKPFSFKDTRELIRFHLERAAANPNSPAPLFSLASQWAIYRLTLGNPKQIIDLCHFIVLTLVIENRKKADWFMTLHCSSLLVPARAKKLQLIRAGSLSSLIVLMLIFGLWSEQIKTLTAPLLEPAAKLSVAQKKPVQKPLTIERIPAATETAQQERAKKADAPEAAPEEEVKPPTAVEEQAAAVTASAVALPAAGEPVAAVTASEDTTAVAAKIAPEAVPPEQVIRETEPEPVEKIAANITPAIKERRNVMPGDTFLVMIQKVYGPGHLKPHYIEQIIAANPQLQDPNNLVVGGEVFFPFLSGEAEKPVAAAKKTESLVAKKLDRELQPVDSPGIIGKLTVLPGDTLGTLIRGVYGPFSFNPDYTAKVVAANTHLRNPHLLEVGETIYFPDLPITPEVGLPAKPTALESRGDIPEFLGEIIAVEDETFGDMVRRIYGPYGFNAENTAKVLAVNPGLKNPDLMSVGQKIRFPTILVALAPDAADAWWVKIISHDNLQSAYRFLRVYSRWAPPMLIIPSRTDAGEVRFNVLLEGSFADEQLALAAIHELPASMTTDAEPLHGLDPDTFYYWMKKKN